MAASAPIPFPAAMKMSDNIASEWKRFRGMWENYVFATNLAEETAARRAAIFLACIGVDAYELFQNLEFAAEADRKDIDKIIEAFEKHCVGETNVTYKRYILTVVIKIALSHLTRSSPKFVV